MPDEQAGTVDAEALETDALSAWVAERRTAALDEAKAREEEALKRWVGDRVAEPELESLDPARKASKPSTSKRPSQTRKAKNRKPRKARQKVAVLASEARAQQNTVGSEPAAELEIPSGVDIEIPISPSPEVVGASQSGWALSSRQARLAFAWYTSALRQKAAPAARGLAHVLARVAQVGLRATLR